MAEPMYTANFECGSVTFSVHVEKSTAESLVKEPGFVAKYINQLLQCGLREQVTTLPEACAGEDVQLQQLIQVQHTDTLETPEPECPEEEDDNKANKPSFTWMQKSTKLLLQEILKRKDIFDNGSQKKITLWKEISIALKGKGCIVSYTQCENKWKGLTKVYRKTKAYNSKNGSNRTCQYEKELDEIMKGQHRYDLSTISSGPLAKESLDNVPRIYSHCRSPGISPSDASTEAATAGGDNSSANHTFHPNNRTTQPCRKVRKEPRWFKEYRDMQERHHKERLAVQREMIAATREIFSDLRNTIMDVSKPD